MLHPCYGTYNVKANGSRCASSHMRVALGEGGACMRMNVALPCFAYDEQRAVRAHVWHWAFAYEQRMVRAHVWRWAFSYRICKEQSEAG